MNWFHAHLYSLARNYGCDENAEKSALRPQLRIYYQNILRTVELQLVLVKIDWLENHETRRDAEGV